MKKIFILLVTALLPLLSACNKENPGVPNVKDPITISSPTPEATLTKVSLSEEQMSYVDGANAFAFKCLSKLFQEEGKSLIFSPLSLQYALAMSVNGASGETAAEITRTLGFSADLEALNTYCNLLLNQLPALDEDVEIKLADALVVDNDFPLLDTYRKSMEDIYYAPVEYTSFSNAGAVVDRINEWAHRNTNGLIYPLLQQRDLTNETIAVLLNALYFKAPWSKYGMNGAMFLEEATQKDAPFYQDGGGTLKVDQMHTARHLGYAEFDGYRMVEIPYSNGRFAMYILLPDQVGEDGLQQLMNALEETSWRDMTGALTSQKEVVLSLPRFETESKFLLRPTLQAMGIRKAFGRYEATFDRMFAGDGQFWISNVLQKARIKVAEWGTEAAAVTAVLMEGVTSVPSVPERVTFIADHPFAYVIAERSSGTLLFEGVFTGE